jgi:hypothetical protein
MNAIMKMHGSEIVKRVQSTYLFEIKPNKETDPVMFTVDLKNGQGMLYFYALTLILSKGKILEGKHGYIDTTFALLDSDFMAMISGKLNPKSALISVSTFCK